MISCAETIGMEGQRKGLLQSDYITFQRLVVLSQSDMDIDVAPLIRDFATFSLHRMKYVKVIILFKMHIIIDIPLIWVTFCVEKSILSNFILIKSYNRKSFYFSWMVFINNSLTREHSQSLIPVFDWTLPFYSHERRINL